MRYKDLVTSIAKTADVEEEEVRRVLDALPEILMQSPTGEQTRTPLGVFSAKERPEKKVQLPNGNWTKASRQLQIRLKPGSRLRKDL